MVCRWQRRLRTFDWQANTNIQLKQIRLDQELEDPILDIQHFTIYLQVSSADNICKHFVLHRLLLGNKKNLLVWNHLV